MTDFHKLIANNRIDQAIQYLERMATGENSSFANELTFIKGNYKNYKSQKIIGLLSYEQDKLEKSRITYSLMQLYDEMKRNISDQTPNNGSSASNETSSDYEIFFSYSWSNKQNQHLEILVDQIYNHLEAENYPVKRDKKDLDFGESINKFMRNLGESTLVMVFLSDKYLKSAFSMFELHEIGRNSRWDKNEFQKRVLPVNLEPEQLELHKEEVKNKYETYWKNELDQLEILLKERGTSVIVDLADTIKTVRGIVHHLRELFNYLSDQNQKTLQLISENDFGEIKKVIDRRVKDL